MGFDFGDTVAGRLLNSLMPDGKGNGLLPGLRLGEGNGNNDDGPDGPHQRGGPHGNDAPHGTGNPHGHDGPNAPGNGSPRAQSPDAPPRTGGPAQPQSMDAPPTGGPAPKGMQEVSPNIVSQLMSDVRTLLQPSATEGARTAAAATNPIAAEAQQASAARHGHGHAPAQVASAATVAAAVPAAAAATTPTSQAASTNAVANAASPTLAQPASTVPRMLGDGTIVPMPNRPADTALAARVDNALLASLTSSLQPVSAPPTLAVPTTLAAPGSTTAAFMGSAQGATMTATTAAGLTMATSVSQPVDARGVILPVNDRASVRLESLGLAGHTLEGLQRRSMRKRVQAMLPQRMTRWLWAMGLMGAQVSDADADPERDVQRVLQWLFWMLAIVAYGCLAVAIVALVGSNGHLFDQPQGRSYTGWLAFFGLLTGTAAWLLARRLTRR